MEEAFNIIKSYPLIGNFMAYQLITDINCTEKTIHTHLEKTHTYDYLVLATGSSAFVPPINGVEKEGVFVYRTIEDLDAIMSYAKKIKIKDKKNGL